MTREDLEFCGVDDWNRPLFRDYKGLYYCVPDQLYQADEMTPEAVEELLISISEGHDELYFKGRRPDGEPAHPVTYSIK